MGKSGVSSSACENKKESKKSIIDPSKKKKNRLKNEKSTIATPPTYLGIICSKEMTKLIGCGQRSDRYDRDCVVANVILNIL
jgi:hypothetical protein